MGQLHKCVKDKFKLHAIVAFVLDFMSILVNATFWIDEYDLGSLCVLYDVAQH